VVVDLFIVKIILGLMRFDETPGQSFFSPPCALFLTLAVSPDFCTCSARSEQFLSSTPFLHVHYRQDPSFMDGTLFLFPFGSTNVVTWKVTFFWATARLEFSPPLVPTAILEV